MTRTGPRGYIRLASQAGSIARGEIAVSKKIRGLMEQGPWIRKMFEEGIALKRRYGDDKVFDLSLENPIMEPPREFYQALRGLGEEPSPGMHRYMPNPGYAEGQVSRLPRSPDRRAYVVWSVGDLTGAAI